MLFRSAFVFLAGVSILVAIFAEDLVSIFRNDPDVIRYGAFALRMQCLSFPLHSFIVMSNMMQQVTGKTVPATFMAMARQGVFYIPLILVLPLFLNVMGIQIAQAVSDTLTFLCAIPIQLYILKHIPKQEN